MKAVLDRIEDGQLAVILVEEINKEIILPKEQLPSGSDIHTWFDVKLEGDNVTSIILDEQTTEANKKETENLMDRVRAKSKGSKFKRR